MLALAGAAQHSFILPGTNPAPDCRGLSPLSDSEPPCPTDQRTAPRELDTWEQGKRSQAAPSSSPLLTAPVWIWPLSSRLANGGHSQSPDPRLWLQLNCCKTPKKDSQTNSAFKLLERQGRSKSGISADCWPLGCQQSPQTRVQEASCLASRPVAAPQKVSLPAAFTHSDISSPGRGHWEGLSACWVCLPTPWALRLFLPSTVLPLAVVKECVDQFDEIRGVAGKQHSWMCLQGVSRED